MTNKIFIFILILLSITSTAQIKGRVTFNDKGMSMVAISDGENVVKTDNNGEYILPANNKARFVFITKPAYYRVIGRHYKAIGSDNYDFKLERNPNETPDGSFSFIHITDTETYTYKNWIDNLRSWVKNNPTSFIIHTGDICYNKGLDFHGSYVRSEHLGTDMFYCIGNHDLVAGDYGEQRWERNFGAAWYSFDAGNIHFMVLPMLGGDYKPSYTKTEILKWMKNDLASIPKDKKVVMFNHDLWFQGNDLMIRTDNDSIDMSKHNLISFHYGHWHSHYIRKVAGITTYSATTPDKGSIDHGASGFRVTEVNNKGEMQSQTRYTYIDGSIAVVSPADNSVIESESNKIPVLINCYRTASETKSVKVSVNGGAWHNLTASSDWCWNGSVAISSKESNNNMKVQALFEDGTILTERVSFNTNSNKKDWNTKWATNVGSNIFMVSPVSNGKMIFTATMDDDNMDKCHIVSLDIDNGKELWRYKTDNSIKGSIICNSSIIAACDVEGNLYALNTDGSLLWKIKLRGGILPQILQGITMNNGVIYAGQGSGFSAIDAATGKVIWQNDAWSSGEGTTSTIAVGEGVVLSSSHWNGLFCHDINNGKLLWKKQDSETRFRDGTPVFYNGKIYMASSSTLMIIDPKSGETIENVKSDNNFNVAAMPVVTDKIIYMSTSDKGIVAYDHKTLKKLWSYNTQPSMFYTVPYSQDHECSVESTPLLIGNTLLFGANDGYLYGIKADDGMAMFKRKIGSPITSSPLKVDKGVIISDFAGNIIKIDCE